MIVSLFSMFLSVLARPFPLDKMLISVGIKLLIYMDKLGDEFEVNLGDIIILKLFNYLSTSYQ